MWPLAVVLLTPCSNHFPCMAHRQKPVFVQTFVSELAIEAFDVRVLLQLTWFDESQWQLPTIRPFFECLASEFRPIVYVTERGNPRLSPGGPATSDWLAPRVLWPGWHWCTKYRDVELIEHPSKLRKPGAVIVLLVIVAEHAGLVAVECLRLAVAFQVRPACFEIAESRFREGEMQVHKPTGGMVDVEQKRAARRPVFKPAVIAVIDLDQFAHT